MLICLSLGGHALLEGVPGSARRAWCARSRARSARRTARIQFTPDLMPADITGTVVLVARRRRAGDAELPGRARSSRNLILADEINRASPRTQSALLEAMQEGTVTIGNESRTSCRSRSRVLATQNPVEMQGTYPLPEAQLDRFLLQAALRLSRPSTS